MPAVARHDPSRGPRRGSRPHALLSALVRAGRGLRTLDLNNAYGPSAPSKQTSSLLSKLRDSGMAYLDDAGLWHATAAGCASIRGLGETHAPAVHFGTPACARTPVRPAPRQELPLVLRPGAEDYRHCPSRRGNTLVWDHLDGRQERITSQQPHPQQEAA